MLVLAASTESTFYVLYISIYSAACTNCKVYDLTNKTKCKSLLTSLCHSSYFVAVFVVFHFVVVVPVAVVVSADVAVAVVVARAVAATAVIAVVVHADTITVSVIFM